MNSIRRVSPPRAFIRERLLHPGLLPSRWALACSLPSFSGSQHLQTRAIDTLRSEDFVSAIFFRNHRLSPAFKKSNTKTRYLYISCWSLGVFSCLPHTVVLQERQHNSASTKLLGFNFHTPALRPYPFLPQPRPTVSTYKIETSTL